MAAGNHHAPTNPSGLRQSVTAGSYGSIDSGLSSSPDQAGYFDRRHSAGPSRTSANPTEATSLLGSTLEFRDHEHVHDGPCDHGTFSPRPTSPGSFLARGREGGDSAAQSESEAEAPKTWAARMRSKKMSTSRDLAERHGIRDNALMYMSYYMPVLVWAKEYNWSYFKGDFVAALTVAGIYVPMALSLADNLAHVPPINGLYSFVFNPLIYALLGSCPAMVIGPEAAGSLLVGTVIKGSVDKGEGGDNDAILHARICGIVAGLAGAMVLIAGVARLGFLDGVLSRPFLRGFISAIGAVIAVDQLIPELGLQKLAEEARVGHASSVDKLRFIIGNLDKAHTLTFTVAATSFAVIMVCREIKRRLQPRYPGVAYIPDRFLVVVLSAFLTYYFEWDKAGVAVLGKVEAASGRSFTFRWPFRWSNMTYIREATSTAFLIALLGFFESSVAAKSLGGASFAGIQLSPNRELVALGVANIVGGCFMSLPGFGGYGRSKVNRSTGGRTPMSSIILSGLTLLCISFCLPYLYYLPKPVLSSLISVVAWSLIEECPHDISFFLKIHAWNELGLMLAILLATIFFSLTLGMAIGVFLSLLQVIRHATRPRIQILGRIPGTNRFENAEANPDRLEFIEGCLIVKIPEPLTFANTGELKTRLRRLELYGTSMAHPALPRLRREDSNRNIIFDIHGVTGLDGSGAQVLEEIVRDYRQRGVRIFFSRVPSRDSKVGKTLIRSGIMELAGGEDHFVNDVSEALKLSEVEEGGESCFGADDRYITHIPRPLVWSPDPPSSITEPHVPRFISEFHFKHHINMSTATVRQDKRDPSRVLGALLGVHAGDSLGATLEFMSWEEIQRKFPSPLRDIIGGGHFGWKAGDATDDTDLTRAVLLAYFAEAKQKAGKKDPKHQRFRGEGVVEKAAWYFVDWFEGRDWPGRVKGRKPMDIGGATAQGILTFKAHGDVKRSGAGEGRAGNGSLMRCIPTALFQLDREKMVDESMAISAVTHDDSCCVVSCVAYNAMARSLVEQQTAEEAWEAGMKALKDVGENEKRAGRGGGRIESAVGKVQRTMEGGRHRVKLDDFALNGPRSARNFRDEIPRGASGYVLESLTLGVAAMFDPRPLEDILVDVVRIGQDTDTNGAIAGGLLGARDGAEAIPLRWREKLQHGEEFAEIVKYLLSPS
ncbi:ADP-ribosylglycohydrolase-domain-containing protein [Triangularia verruculosa]|uniref:ADP-ribosylglycohydrolase-domain-containing protein n=1 Tax=Triangularia verruculosa TaxID=2587418 RepID=A0AAN6XPP6_9PEZI|nr:ADP-ribosylglycohydrolase-domain-containing protein [Triangularia verruculosa]